MKVYVIAALCALASCTSYFDAAKRLSPPTSTRAVRYDDIVNSVEDDPVTAIHLIGIYQAIYGEDIKAGDAVVEQADAGAGADSAMGGAYGKCDG